MGAEQVPDPEDTSGSGATRLLWTRHRGWVQWLVAAGLLYPLPGLAAQVLPADLDKRNPDLALLILVVLLAIILACWASLLLAVRGGYRSWRAMRRSQGHYTKRERVRRDRSLAVAAHEQAARDRWDEACRLTRRLAAGQPPAPLTAWGIVLRPGESVLLDGDAQYARWYGGGGAYTHVNGIYWGSLPFMAFGYGLTAAVNSSRRRAAAADALVCWREHQTVRVLVTDQRLLCLVQERWLTFDYTAATAFYPEPANWSLVFDFASAAPLRLGGVLAPAIAVLAVWAVHGADALPRHPALEPLRTGA
ncbi:MAG TPA: hypothetical protein VFP72_22160 [Kineosporiaceae bacterium]|nr:hypothetical protein [Kineosporiaceae bacterium]